nr:hypothetical protein [Aquihabitans sp. G128]
MSTEEEAGAHPRQADGGIEDDAGQAHPARRGPEEVGVAGRRDLLPPAGRRDDGEGLHRIAPGADLVVVLAVDVGRDGPADGDLAGAGRDGHEPAQGDEPADERIDAGAGLGGDEARFQVEVVDPRHARGQGHGPPAFCAGSP